MFGIVSGILVPISPERFPSQLQMVWRTRNDRREDASELEGKGTDRWLVRVRIKMGEIKDREKRIVASSRGAIWRGPLFSPLPSRSLTGHLPASLVNMSGPSFGQRAIALTTSSCHRGVAQGRFHDGSFPSSGEYTAIPFAGYQSAESEIAAEETTWKENTAWTGRGRGRDNQRLWRHPSSPFTRCRKRCSLRTGKMTDRNKLILLDCRPPRFEGHRVALSSTIGARHYNLFLIFVTRNFFLHFLTSQCIFYYFRLLDFYDICAKVARFLKNLFTIFINRIAKKDFRFTFYFFGKFGYQK